MLDNLTIHTPAKINLFLKVLSKRDDGYHNIRTGVTFIDLFDKIEIKRSKKTIINYSGPFKPENGFYKDCIIYKIINSLKLENKINLQIDIQKNIPVQGGLGSASSNAAGFIEALKKMNLIKIKDFEFYAFLGADIPSFLFKKNCLVTGMGEKIFKYNFPQYYFLLVKPNCNLSTKDMYKKLKIKKVSFDDLDLQHNEVNDDDMGNDFEEIIKNESPEINELLNFLSRIQDTIFTRMTGTGSCCYAVFENEYQAKKGQEYFNSYFPNLWNYLAKNSI